MKKLPAVLLIFISTFSFGQMAEIGYNTFDIGGEFQYYKHGKFVGFHLAINSKLHHSFHGEVGYYIAGDPTATFYRNVNNGGVGLGVGYRYYTMLRPHAFFVGAKANLFSNEVAPATPSPETYSSLIFIPSFETGYMFLINDMVFITPTAAIGYKTSLRSELKADKKEVVVLVGISIGYKF